MAINADAGRKAAHSLIIGTTGAGKSQACKNLIPASKVRLVAFDPDGDHSWKPVPGQKKPRSHQCYGYDNFNQFCRELLKADKSGRPFRIAYTGAKGDKDFENFCGVVWDILDGKVDTHIILEEVGQFTKSKGPALEEYGDLLRRGRKYGAIAYTVAQRAAEVPSTARQQCRFRYVGLVDGEDDAKSAAKFVDITAASLLAIEPDTLTFYRKESGKAATKMRFKYIK